MEIKLKTPFYSQKWDLNNWKELGFESYEDAKYWEKSSCAILCLKMVLDAINPSNGKTISSLIKEGLDLNAYTDKEGWSHKGLFELAENNGLKANAYEKLNIEDLKNALDNNLYPMVSIKWAFETYKSLGEKILFWKRYGGHLALVVGYKEENGKLEGFYVHHTSIRPEYNWENRFIPLNRFKDGFTKRGIITGCKQKLQNSIKHSSRAG